MRTLFNCCLGQEEEVSGEEEMGWETVSSHWLQYTSIQYSNSQTVWSQDHFICLKTTVDPQRGLVYVGHSYRYLPF